MKKVYVHAFLAGNVGDDLFVRMLCRRYPKVLFRTIADRSYKTIFSDLPNMQVFSPGDPEIAEMTAKLQKYKWAYGTDDFHEYLLKHSDAVVHIGGSVFVQHQDDWSEAYAMDEKLAKMAKRLYVVGANFGPYTDKRYKETYHELFKKYKGICFRDHYSADLFADLKQVSYAPDVLFGYPLVPAEKKKQVVFAPIELANRGGKNSILEFEDSYLTFHKLLAKEFLSRGYDLCFLSFCRMQSDDTMIEKICQDLSEEERGHVSVRTFDGAEAPITEVFAESEICIGTRFHSIILGLLGACKAFGIIYDQKTRNVLKDLGFARKLELFELERKSEAYVRKIVVELITSEPVNVADMVKGAEQQWRYTDKFLK